ncbi:dipeptidyl-peptidase-like protein V precursor [Rhizodiscina lignyota]|uniref:Dipeptidyl-peptidase V n=1 Tax=Rhizodiscina lignyota TaxID=1504668 RepID=A0A9P4M4B0_9PEZI|nr:dipeptidyl-peptidase-like protein V precursor [Rhizodiscina lignyota]
MVIKPNRLTPELMLGAPRRSPGLLNSNGSLILHNVYEYSFAEHKGSTDIRVLDVETGDITVVTKPDSVISPQWLGADHLLYLAPTEEGTTKVVVGSISDFDDDSYVAGVINGIAGTAKIKKLDHHSYLFAISAQAKPDGSLVNPLEKTTRHHEGRLYDSIYVRHWNYYLSSNRASIFYGKLFKDSSDGKWQLSELTNALNGTGLESPVPAFGKYGDSSDFDISSTGIVFVAKDPKLQPATNTKSNVYLMTLHGFDGTQSLPKPYKVSVNGYEGASSSPVFSGDGGKVAFLQMTQNGYESDRREIFTIPDVRRPAFINHLIGFPELKMIWDVNPASLSWSLDGKKLFVLGEQKGINCLWTMSADYLHLSSVPAKIFDVDGVLGFQQLDSGEVFVSGSNFVDNSTYYRLVPKTASSYSHHLISSNAREGSLFGLSRSQVEEIWFDGAEQEVHAWVLKPSTFRKGQRYPLAYCIHGGPQGAWGDEWGTRWNAAVFAEQGYVVVMPNPTGSTGYGQRFCDAIQNQWGGLPYEDLVKGFEYIEQNLDYVDTSRSVALGASYGGYMINWIQGQPLGRKFKALVCHDGVFSMAGQMASEELYFPEHEFGGKFWDNPKGWLKWDPSRYTRNWDTPQLVIHSANDYRLTISEGLAAFNVLQDRGIESRFLTFSNEDHWVIQPESSLLWHTVVLDFINKHVGLPLYSEQSKRAKRTLEEAQILDPSVSQEE